ncbi:transposase [Collimonas arenae]|uniref:transposase n=1 Tax=Collimonas arenae TaxID=279058 RepID=UPI00056E6A26|nr:transposase [Collimonas arenae]
MSKKRYTDEFRIEAVKQVTDRGYTVAVVADRLGVSHHSLYQWIKRFRVVPAEYNAIDEQRAEIRRLTAELKRISEERDIFKMAATNLTKAAE